MKHLLLILALGFTMLFTVTHAMGQTNVALGKVAKQLSDAFPNGLASSAVDGNTDGNFFNGSVTHTTSMDNPWWTVDLGADHQIDEIRIWNRTDCCAERLNNVSVNVFAANGEVVRLITVRDRDVPDVARRIEVIDANGATTVLSSPSTTNPIIIPLNITGRHVTLGFNKENAILSLAEVEVFGSPRGQPAPVPTPVPRPVQTPVRLVNFARGAKVYQSSTHLGGDANRAIDGNTDGNWSNGSVTHTKEEFEPFLEIDLGSVKKIEEIRIFSRTDCCRERLGHFIIMFSESTIYNNNSGGFFYNEGGYEKGREPEGDAFFFRTPFSARYIRIYLVGTGYLSLAEVEILGK
jgi:hypothetical protein